MTTSSTRMKAVKAIVWKEWRERFLWALASAILLAFVLSLFAYSTYKDAPLMYSRDYRNFGDLWSLAQTFVACGVPVLALYLGFSQMRSEGKRDSWAFMIHRPATRQLIFWSKSLAGLSLCAFVVFFSYGAFALWAATDINIPAPFNWQMLHFGWVVVALCIPPYFAGALTALRTRRWFGSRVLPVLGILCCLVVVLSHNLWGYDSSVRNLAYVAFGLLLAVAAQGSFESERTQTQNLWSQVALSSTLFAGLGTVLLFVLVVVAVAESNQNAYSRPADSVRYIVTESGRLVTEEIKQSADVNVTAQTTLRDGAGRIIVQDVQASQPQNRPLKFTPFVKQNAEFAPLPINYDKYFIPLGQLRDGNYVTSPEVMWWFDCFARRIVGYLGNPKQVYGYIGVNGFVKNARDCQPFDENPLVDDYDAPIAIAFPHSIYEFDWRNKSVRKIHQSVEEIVASRTINLRMKTMGEQPQRIVMTTKSIVFLSPEGKSQPILLPDIRHFVSLIAKSSNDHFWLQFSPRWNHDLPTTFVELSATGAVLQKTVLPSLPITQSVYPWVARVAMAFSPPILTQWNVYRLRSAVITGAYAGENAARQGVLASAILSAVAALFAHLRARRYGFTSSTRWAWTIAVLLLGPLGFPLMIALLDWPTREKCASCGKLRVVNREKCEYCGVSFSSPPRDGTEIYDEVETRELVAVA